MRSLHSSRAGFALPLVLVTIAVLTLVFGMSLRALITLKDETKLAMTRADFLREAMTAEARMAFLIVTEPFGASSINIGGSEPNAQLQVDPLGIVYLDGRQHFWREVAGDEALPLYLASVQDEAGLVNLYDADEFQLERLFEQIGGLDPVDAETLAAEIIEYNLDPTAHQPMRRASEIYRLESAQQVLTDAAWRRIAERAVSYSDNRAININTAPAEVLAVWFDLDLEEAQEIVANREGTVLASTADIGVTVTANRNYAFSGGRLRFTFSDPETGLSYRSSLVMTPNSGERPVWIENPQIFTSPTPPTVDQENDPEFPEIPDYAS